ncbi:MAG: hypothetical protein P4L46_03210 [Fimbriimonas sp.]|nr:hypothetical protein [Fimbriimonas sp.]
MKRVTSFLIAGLATASAFGASDSISVMPTDVSTAKLAPSAPFVPTFGIRVGGGNWNQFVYNAGINANFSVPLLPLPTLRVDAEVWGSSIGFGSDRRGNAVSLLGVQNMMLGYVGIGPSFYFTDDQGAHKSGFGVKLLGGLNLPDSSFVEAGLILGPSTPPLFITVGRKF